MQTFYISTDYDVTARALDRQRLGKQRVEAMQILKALLTGQGWVYHPATKMWAGYELALFDYYTSMLNEWQRRGYKDTTMAKVNDLMTGVKTVNARPDWHFDERIMQSHRYNLYHKLPSHYSQWANETNVTCCAKCNYYWPTHVTRQDM